MNFSNLTDEEIESWNTSQICAALVEAKKIESIYNKIKELARNKIKPGRNIKVSNGSVKIQKGGETFTYNEKLVDENYLLSPKRPLNKKKVKAHLIDTGGLPDGVNIKISKNRVVIKIDSSRPAPLRRLLPQT